LKDKKHSSWLIRHVWRAQQKGVLNSLFDRVFWNFTKVPCMYLLLQIVQYSFFARNTLTILLFSHQTIQAKSQNLMSQKTHPEIQLSQSKALFSWFAAQKDILFSVSRSEDTIVW
jgi:hypothetical protein